MESIDISSGLAHFRLIDRFTKISVEGMRATVMFDRYPPYAGLEALAQVAALHARYVLQFERHAFLLKIRDWRMPVSETLDGTFDVEATLGGQSSHAFMYDAIARGPNGTAFSSQLLIGTKAYDERFSKERLKKHYQTLLATLKT